MKRFPSSSSQWIVSLSIRIYQVLLSMGPAEFHREYGLPVIQVFRQCCYDAYQQRGAFGVMSLWLPMFSEVVTGMMAERLSALGR